MTFKVKDTTHCQHVRSKSYLDLLYKADKLGQLTRSSTMHAKCADLSFPVVNFPIINSIIKNNSHLIYAT